MTEKKFSEEDLKPVCKSCMSQLCKGLYWKNIIVSSDFSIVPFNCPMKINDENRIRFELQYLSEHDFSLIRNDFLVKYNSGFNYVSANDHITGTIATILSYLHRGQCAIICKSANIFYKPWRFFGHDESNIYDFVQTFKKNGREVKLSDDELTISPLPAKIKNLSWQHTGTTLQNESPKIAYNGNTVELQTHFENYVEGAGVDFFIYGNVNSARKQLAKIHTRCNNMRAVANWTIDISQCDSDNPGLAFNCEVHTTKSVLHPIEIATRESGGFCLYLNNEDGLIIDQIDIVVTCKGEEIFNGTMEEGSLQIEGIPENELLIELRSESSTQKYPIRWCPGKPPYIPEKITIRKTAYKI